MKKYYVYIHVKPNGEVFYVGKGCGRRAFESTRGRRSIHWIRVKNKYGFKVIIVGYYDTEEEALEEEIKLIAEYRSLGIELINETNGGDGTSGHKHSKETKLKQSKARIGKNKGLNYEEIYGSDKAKEISKKLSDAKIGENNHFYGKSHSEEIINYLSSLNLNKSWEEMFGEDTAKKLRKKRSEAYKGEGNPFYGKTHTEESKEKNRKFRKGKSLVELLGEEGAKKSIAKQIVAQTGSKRSIETKIKISNALKGKPKSYAHKAALKGCQLGRKD